MADPPPEACCGPHVFTSVLLGVLACVLMTGGVFLAFHRWDPLWLIVSVVGVVLILIGSILHCCRTPRVSKGGCCLPDHLHNHVVLNSGSLTEQLLPLSNARSVSQLSLNMLPGYFPPVVTTYGIEQHSTVVQNINRIIQQQTGQGPVTPGSPEKNYILLSLPTNTSPAHIQNLVATVCQLDGSVLTNTSTAADVASSVPSATTTDTIPPVRSTTAFKDAEVQTCVAWPVPNSTSVASPSTSSTPFEPITTPMSTQTDAIEITIDLIDCIPSSICDPAAAQVSSDCVTSVEDTSSSVLVDVSTEEPTVDNSSLSSPDDDADLLPSVECVETPDDMRAESSNDLTDSLSLLDVEDRSSPPPRYEDVALEGENSSVVLGLAYGTL